MPHLSNSCYSRSPEVQEWLTHLDPTFTWEGTADTSYELPECARLAIQFFDENTRSKGSHFVFQSTNSINSDIHRDQDKATLRIASGYKNTGTFLVKSLQGKCDFNISDINPNFYYDPGKSLFDIQTDGTLVPKDGVELLIPSLGQISFFSENDFHFRPPLEFFPNNVVSMFSTSSVPYTA